MRLKLPKHVHGFVDRHGRSRYYARKPGTKSVPLPGQPYTPEFMEAYQAAVGGAAVVKQIGAERTLPGTLNAAIISYVNSGAWTHLSKGTQGARRAILEHLRQEHGDKRMAKLSSRPLMVILERKKPHAQRNWLKTLRGLCQHAQNIGMLNEDPTAGIKLRPAPRTKGFHTWEEHEIEQFEAHHHIGTRPRLALALLLYTGQRRSDIVKLGRQHERGTNLRIIQKKTGTELLIPMHADLRAIIDATPNQHLNYLVTEFGKPFTPAGFGGWFADQCKAAGIPDVCRAHGLRKAICRRLAEAGCTAPQIASISGHMSLKEVQRYIEGANRTMMAREGMATLTRVFSSTDSENSHSQTQNKGLQIEAKSS